MLIYVFILWLHGILFVTGTPLTIRLSFRQWIHNRTPIKLTDLEDIEQGEYSDLFFVPKLTILSEGTVCIANGPLITVATRINFVKNKKGEFFEIYRFSKSYIDHFKEASRKQTSLWERFLTDKIIAFYDETSKDWKVMNIEVVRDICGVQFYQALQERSREMTLTFGFPSYIHNIILDSVATTRLVFIPQGDNLQGYLTRPPDISTNLKALVASTQSNSESQIQEGSHSKEKFSISEISYKISEYRWKCSQSDISMSSCQVRTDHDGDSPFVPEIEKFPSNLPTTSRNSAISTQLQSELTPEEINNWIEDLYDPEPW